MTVCGRSKVVPQPILEEMTLSDAHFGLFKDHVFSSCVARGIANGRVPALASVTSSSSVGSGASDSLPSLEPRPASTAAFSHGSSGDP